jgi:hypothetical protein
MNKKAYRERKNFQAQERLVHDVEEARAMTAEEVAQLESDMELQEADLEIKVRSISDPKLGDEVRKESIQSFRDQVNAMKIHIMEVKERRSYSDGDVEKMKAGLSTLEQKFRNKLEEDI